MNTTDRVAAPSAAICDLTARSLITAPFPYVTHSHFINPEFYQQLRASFPICPPSTGPTGFSLYWGDAVYQQLLDEHPAWQALFNTFHSQQFIDWCVNQFAAVWEQEGCQLDLAKARYVPYREDRIDKERATLRQIEYEPHELWVRMDVHQGRVGYARHIHLDHARRLLSMLVYLCDHAENQMTGGELFLHTAAQLHEEQAPPVRITPQHNLMVAFPCMRRSHHSVSAITAMAAPRNYLQVHISSSVDIWEPVAKLRQMTAGRAVGHRHLERRAAPGDAHLAARSDLIETARAHPLPASEQRDLETSRRKLLNALAGATDITLIRNFGNIGDQLIHAGMRSLLADIAYREVSLLQLEGVRGQLVVITGSGAWCQPHSHMTQYLSRIEAQFERVIVFPSSFDVRKESVRQVLAQSRALFFAREQISYEQIRHLCQADLAHDTAFFFDYEPYRRPGRGLLTAYRTDREAAGHLIPPGNDDISTTCETLDEWLWQIARHEVVETDRAHVMIAAALLGKQVYYRASSYHKVPAIAAFALGDYAVTRLGESRALVVKEQLLREARALAAQLPAGFFATHAELAVTVVMLSHGRLTQTLTAIRALQEHVRIPFKLLLVDNDSGAEVQEELTKISQDDEGIELILLDENLGCAGGRAYALARVTTPYALLIDNDVEVLPGAVEHLLHYIEQEVAAAAVMGKVVLPDGALHLCGGDYRVVDGVLHFELLGSGRRFDEAIGASGPCRWVSGTLTMVRTAVFARHPYDLGLRHYYEDLEWCYRLNEAGAGAFHRCVEALAIHDHEAKTPAAALSVTEQRRQAIKYVATIAYFYRQHGVIIPNLFDFVPELRTADGQPNLAAARLLLALVNAYGDEWALTQWERGEFAPLFARPVVAPSRSAALEIELSAGADEVTLLKQELAIRHAELHARRHEPETFERTLAQSRSEIAALREQAAARQSEWEQWLAQSAKREQELAVIFNSRSWRALDLYWRARRALRSIVARNGDAGRR